jgi:hypothetical protein
MSAFHCFTSCKKTSLARMRVAVARGYQRTTRGALKSNGDGNQSDRAPLAHLIWGALHNKAAVSFQFSPFRQNRGTRSQLFSVLRNIFAHKINFIF